MITKTFINGDASTKFNAATIGMLYTYWHEIAKDGITYPTIDEQKEIEELLSLLPRNTVITQITLQELATNKFTYTYVFKRSCIINNSSAKTLAADIIKFKAFLILSKIKDLTENGGHYYITPINGTDLVIGTFIG